MIHNNLHSVDNEKYPLDVKQTTVEEEKINVHNILKNLQEQISNRNHHYTTNMSTKPKTIKEFFLKFLGYPIHNEDIKKASEIKVKLETLQKQLRDFSKKSFSSKEKIHQISQIKRQVALLQSEFEDAKALSLSYKGHKNLLSEI